jgi:SPP1 gp7 family putative phage head morphogenesis protein
MFSGVDEAIRQAIAANEDLSKAADPQKKAIARNAVKQKVKSNETKLVKELKKLYADAGMRGTKEALTQLGGAAKLGSGMSGLVGGVEWSKWQPGHAQAAEKVAGKGLGDLLRNADVVVRGITETTLTRMGDVIAGGLEAGSTYREISDAVSELLDDPLRADVISITETNRAFNASAIDEYQAAEMPGFEWLSYAGACDECEMEDGPHDFGDEYPPVHPNCRCAVVVLMPDGSTEEIDSEE